jgi:CheY-like chemotaxis protein
MNIIHLSRDLLLVARVSAAARGAGSSCQAVASVEKLLQLTGQPPHDGTGEPERRRLLIDLQLPGLSIDCLIQQLTRIDPAIEVIAYAQHVMTELLDAARAAGIRNVLTRGQFDRNVNELVV